MTKAYFYPQSTYSIIAAFCELFNDLTVRVYDKNNDIVGVKPVPMSLITKEKIVAILSKDTNDVDPQFDNYLPRISISPPNGFTFAANRNRGKNDVRLLNIEYNLDNKKRTMQTDVQGAPYDLTFEVTIWTKYMVDGLQLIEYLTPYFAPEKYISIKERNFGLEHKSKVTLTSISPNIIVELGETERRVITWNLAFTVESVMYKPMEITPEILCANITVAGVPCKRLPFYGDKIAVYEPDTGIYEPTISTHNKVSLYTLDASEEYDKMIKYWRIANNVMDPPHFESCTNASCSGELTPRPEWDSSITVVSCSSPKMLPCVTVDISGYITNYWQEQVTGPDNIIRLVSYRRIYDPKGVTISGPEIVENSTYPTSCYPIYTAPITSVTPTSSPEVPDNSGSPETPPITSDYVDPCIVPPSYNTTAT